VHRQTSVDFLTTPFFTDTLAPGKVGQRANTEVGATVSPR